MGKIDFTGFTFQPATGAVVHITRANRWNIPAGRYTLHHRGAQCWELRAQASDALQPIGRDQLADAVSLGTITPIDPEQDRLDAERVRLRLASPLSGRGMAGRIAEPAPLFESGTAPQLFDQWEQ